MIPWKVLDTAVIPGDGGTLTLFQRGDEYSIRVGNYELMNSRVFGSEEALASLVLDRLATKEPRVLVGGLGMGFTMMAVLQHAATKAHVVVSELVPEVVKWHRGPLSVVSKGMIDDPRVEIRAVDVAKIIRQEENAFDAILLDVDNGPSALTAKQNDRIYDRNGLAAAKRALRPGGIFAVWSQGPDAKFTRRLAECGFESEEIVAHSRAGKRGPKYLIWLAKVAS
jgi:spermidine synthase